MREKFTASVVPLYLFACLVLGGSAQAIWGNLLLQLMGLGILLWALFTRHPMESSPHARPMAWLGVLLAGLIAMQLIPLPAALWSLLPGRAAVAQELRQLGQPVAAMPLTLDAYSTWTAALQLIAPTAIIVGIVRLGAYRASWLVAGLTLGTIGGVLLGAAQLTAAPAGKSFYLYKDVNLNAATGFFANANHMGSLLLCTIPFLAAVIARSLGRGMRSSRDAHGVAVIAGGALFVVLVGIALNSSLAVWMLTVPVLAASFMLLVPSRPVRRALGGLASVALLITPLIVHFAAKREASSTVSVNTRAEMARHTMSAIRDFLPVGSGIGSFVRLYPQYEPSQAVDATYVVHAHDDYLEIALEAGVPGLILLGLFLLWFVRRCFAAWRGGSADQFARAASIAGAALLLHSVVDYPLRTSALAGVFAMCVALLAEPRSRKERRPSDVDQPAARHLSL